MPPQPRAGTKLASSPLPTVVGCTRGYAYLSRPLEIVHILTSATTSPTFLLNHRYLSNPLDEMVSTLLWMCGYVIPVTKIAVGYPQRSGALRFKLTLSHS